MLMWHRRLGHLNMNYIQKLTRDNILPTQLLRVKKIPVCPDCKSGEQYRKSANGRGTIYSKENYPGKRVSGDQMIANVPGHIMSTKGRKYHKRHKLATIWIDRFSRFMTAHTHGSTSVGKLLQPKTQLEAFAKRFSVFIKSYRTDNGSFISKKFEREISKAKQRLTACRVGTHW